MIWKKKKDAAAQSAEAAGEMTGAKGRTGAGAFAKKNWKWLVPLVVVAAAGAVFLIGGGRNGAASRDVTYAETTPVRQDVSNSLSGTGTLNPANTYTVKSLVDGKILTGGFEEGDKVEEGDVLYARTLPPIWKRPALPCSRPSAATTRLWTASMSAQRWTAPSAASRSQRATR